MKEWKLTYYKSTALTVISNKKLIEAVADLTTSDEAQRVTEWKVGARNIPDEMIRLIADATGLTIENLSHLREQELLCKGIFTELW